jgi:hypothetical protein
MRRDVKINSSLDIDAARILDIIARQEAESNRSLALRLLLREAGARRGLLVPVGPVVNHAVEVRNVPGA